MRRGLLSRFTVLSLATVGGFAAVMGVVLSALLTRAVSDWEWENTAALVRREVRLAGLEPVFAAGPRPRGPERTSELAALVNAVPEVVGVKAWDARGTILWSDEGHLIGRRFPDNESLRRALHGELTVQIKSRGTAADRTDARPRFPMLAEVYVPIRSAGGEVVGVVEVYKTPERLLATIRRGRIIIWSISAVAALGLCLILHRLLVHAYRKEVQEETLRAYAGKLETEVAQRTAQLLHAQKLEAVGLLAGGIAHDFNNLLTVVLSRIELVLDRVGPEDPLRRNLELMDQAAGRAAVLTRQLLAFSRRQVLAPRVLDLNGVVLEMEKMLRPLLGEPVELVTVLAPDLGRVSADPGQVEQVIANLAVNARDAMPQGGRLTLRTANVQVDGPAAGERPGLRPGRYVLLGVTDTGVGMDPATQARIFEPFFTTKEPGKGTGLGLSTVYGIVQQHGGHISLESAAGRGTTFRIHLPRVEAGAEAAGARAREAGAPPAAQTVLVADDDPDARELAGRTLRDRGYIVLETPDGESALRTSRMHPGPIHLLLTDVVMPSLNGWELGRQLTAARPDARVLYMTRYSEIALVHDGPSGAAFLRKPFTPEALLERVREVLDGARALS